MQLPGPRHSNSLRSKLRIDGFCPGAVCEMQYRLLKGDTRLVPPLEAGPFVGRQVCRACQTEVATVFAGDVHFEVA